MTKSKVIKVKDEDKFCVELYEFILEHTSAKLIGIETAVLCRDFMKKLKKIYLSEELQNRFIDKAEKRTNPIEIHIKQPKK